MVETTAGCLPGIAPVDGFEYTPIMPGPNIYDLRVRRIDDDTACGQVRNPIIDRFPIRTSADSFENPFAVGCRINNVMVYAATIVMS